ncbi:MAG TPA: hypothetical protein VMJ30_00580 [Gemmatimonadales bacterium]|nr:hypothetical protein [Gemmatimonadales bacterium]
MRSGFARLTATSLLALALAGCAQTFDATRLGVPVTMASAAGAPPAGDHFVLHTHATYALWGIATLSQPSLHKALASQIGDGTAVSNLQIQVYSGFTDVLFTILTAGIVVPRTVRFEGDITGAVKPLVPPAPPPTAKQ